MPKNIYDSCAEMERVFNAIKNNPLFKNEYGIENGKEMIAELSNQDFVEKLKATYRPGNLDSSFCFIQPGISHNVLCI